MSQRSPHQLGHRMGSLNSFRPRQNFASALGSLPRLLERIVPSIIEAVGGACAGLSIPATHLRTTRQDFLLSICAAPVSMFPLSFLLCIASFFAKSFSLRAKLRHRSRISSYPCCHRKYLSQTYTSASSRLYCEPIRRTQTRARRVSEIGPMELLI